MGKRRFLGGRELVSPRIEGARSDRGRLRNEKGGKHLLRRGERGRRRREEGSTCFSLIQACGPATRTKTHKEGRERRANIRKEEEKNPYEGGKRKFFMNHDFPVKGREDRGGRGGRDVTEEGGVCGRREIAPR